MTENDEVLYQRSGSVCTVYFAGLLQITPGSSQPHISISPQKRVSVGEQMNNKTLQTRTMGIRRNYSGRVNKQNPDSNSRRKKERVRRKTVVG